MADVTREAVATRAAAAAATAAAAEEPAPTTAALDPDAAGPPPGRAKPSDDGSAPPLELEWPWADRTGDAGSRVVDEGAMSDPAAPT